MRLGIRLLSQAPFQGPHRTLTAQEAGADTPEEKSGNSLGLRVIGILNRTYIIAEKADGLILIDQHAAHERILFEKILKGYI